MAIVDCPKCEDRFFEVDQLEQHLDIKHRKHPEHEKLVKQEEKVIPIIPKQPLESEPKLSVEDISLLEVMDKELIGKSSLSVEMKSQNGTVQTNSSENIPTNVDDKNKFTNQTTISKTSEDDGDKGKSNERKRKYETMNEMSIVIPRKRGKPKKNILLVNKTEMKTAKYQKVKKCSVILQKLNFSKDVVYELKRNNVFEKLDIVSEQQINNNNDNVTQTKSETQKNIIPEKPQQQMLKKEIASPKKTGDSLTEMPVPQSNSPKNEVVTNCQISTNSECQRLTIRLVPLSKLLKNAKSTANERNICVVSKDISIESSDISIESSDISIDSDLNTHQANSEQLKPETNIRSLKLSDQLSVPDSKQTKSTAKKINFTKKQIKELSGNKLISSFFRPIAKPEEKVAITHPATRSEPNSSSSEPKVHSNFNFLVKSLNQRVESGIKCGTCSERFRDSDQLLLHIHHCSINGSSSSKSKKSTLKTKSF